MWGAQEKSGGHIKKNFGRREVPPTCKLLPTPLCSGDLKYTAYETLIVLWLRQLHDHTIQCLG